METAERAEAAALRAEAAAATMLPLWVDTEPPPPETTDVLWLKPRIE